MRVLSESEALVVAELLEQVADDQSNERSSELRTIAQRLIVQIDDRLEASSPAPAIVEHADAVDAPGSSRRSKPA